MNSYFWLLVAILATERLTSIVYREKIAEPLRYWIGERKDIHTGLDSFPDTFLGKLFACFWCLSVWVALLVTIVWYIFP